MYTSTHNAYAIHWRSIYQILSQDYTTAKIADRWYHVEHHIEIMYFRWYKKIDNRAISSTDRIVSVARIFNHCNSFVRNVIGLHTINNLLIYQNTPKYTTENITS